MLYDVVTRPAIDRAVALVFLSVRDDLAACTAHRTPPQAAAAAAAAASQLPTSVSASASASASSRRRRLFVWAGLDFIVSADGRPWLLEANVKPAGRFLDAAAQFPSEPVAAMARAAYAGLAQLVEAENGHNNHNDDNDDDDMSNGDDAASSGGQHQGEMRWLKLDIPALLRA